MAVSRADVVFVNGWVYTGLEDVPREGGLAVADGVIVSTDAAEVRSLAASAGECVDLAGRLLIAGFQDAHLHPFAGGMELLSCNLTECGSAEEVLQTISFYAREHPGESWVQGAGWSMDCFAGGTPTARMLDGVVSDRPAVFENCDHHGTWANSLALRLAGITRDTPDPVDGRIERDEFGEPTGMLHEGAAALLSGVRPVPSREQALLGLQAAQRMLLSYGVTAWQDAGVGVFLSAIDTFPVYLEALESGLLRVRVRGAQWWNRQDGRAQLARLLERAADVRARFDSARFSLAGAKVMVDGVAENFTAAMHDCYLDRAGCATDNRGTTFFDPGEIAEFVSELDAAGMQVHFHALGDRAVSIALDALERARRVNGVSGVRHHLAHLQLVRERDVQRFAELGAVANLQALWACHEEQLDELTIPFLGLGVERARERHYPFGELAAAGVRLAAGSDWPVSSADPLQAIHVAVNRVSPGGAGVPLGSAGQCLTVAQAVNAYTSGSAYVNGFDGVSGVLVPGFAADLVVLDRNIFAVPVQDIWRARVDETWVGGERLFCREG